MFLGTELSEMKSTNSFFILILFFFIFILSPPYRACLGFQLKGSQKEGQVLKEHVF